MSTARSGSRTAGRVTPAPDSAIAAATASGAASSPARASGTEPSPSPITNDTTTHLLTARATARHMVEQGSGVNVTLAASAVRLPDPAMGPPLMGGFGVACAAIEALTHNLAG